MLVSAGQIIVLAGIAKTANTSPKGTLFTSGAPCPARTSANGKMVISETVDRCDGAHKEAEENVEAMMAVVVPARRGNKNGGTKRDKSEDQEINRGRCSLATEGLDLGVVLLSISAEW